MAEVCTSPLKPFGKRNSIDSFNENEHSHAQSIVQKRRRFEDNNFSPENNVPDHDIGFRGKRCRGEEENYDVPRYTEAHMQQLEESKNEEMQRMRDEMQQYVAHKEHEQKQKCDEIIGEMQEQMRQGKAELDRLNQENAVLKHGIRIQQTQVENAQRDCESKYRTERDSFIQMGMEAAANIRRLEGLNYSLRVQLEQMAPSSSETPSTPRWGY